MVVLLAAACGDGSASPVGAGSGSRATVSTPAAADTEPVPKTEAHATAETADQEGEREGEGDDLFFATGADKHLWALVRPEGGPGALPARLDPMTGEVLATGNPLEGSDLPFGRVEAAYDDLLVASYRTDDDRVALALVDLPTGGVRDVGAVAPTGQRLTFFTGPEHVWLLTADIAEDIELTRVELATAVADTAVLPSDPYAMVALSQIATAIDDGLVLFNSETFSFELVDAATGEIREVPAEVRGTPGHLAPGDLGQFWNVAQGSTAADPLAYDAERGLVRGFNLEELDTGVSKLTSGALIAQAGDHLWMLDRGRSEGPIPVLRVSLDDAQPLGPDADLDQARGTGTFDVEGVGELPRDDETCLANGWALTSDEAIWAWCSGGPDGRILVGFDGSTGAPLGTVEAAGVTEGVGGP